MSFDPHIRMKAFDAAMELSADNDPLHAVGQVMAITHTLEHFLSGRELFQKADDAPTAEGPVDEVTHTGEPEIASIGDVVYEANAPATLNEDTVREAVSELRKTVAKARVPKAKAKKAKTPRKPKLSREEARDEAGTPSHDEGSQVPVDGDPVPDEQLQAA